MSIAVSVVIPTYKRAEMLGPTIESILDQSHPPAEVIVIDDGSPDNTEAAVRRFPSVVKYHRIENSGQSQARNVGVSLATSPLIAFCDHDDLWKREKLARQVALHSKSGIDFSFTNFQIVRNGEWSQSTKFDTAPPGYFDGFRSTPEGLLSTRSYYDDLVMFSPIFPSTEMVSKKFFDSLGGFRGELGRNPTEDWEFHLRCFAHSPIGAIEEPLAGICKHESNMSGDHYFNAVGGIELLEYALSHHALSQKSREVVGERIVRLCKEAGFEAYDREDFSNCSTWLRRVPARQRDQKEKLKLLISSCPAPLARGLYKIIAKALRRG
jgi:glycosyltransferase involved in cell wall biosynthesis